ncbi:MAG: HpcH/HpaI aldolase/citrate lyase family protein [Trebonia sp.]
MRLRSTLVVPGNRPDRIARAAGYNPDALSLDLEDSVPPAEHDAARGHIARYLDARPSLPVFVRPVSVGRPEFDADLEAIVRPGLTGLVLPQVEGPDEVRAVDERLRELEADRGLASGSVVLLPAAESAAAVRCLFDIVTASPRVLGTNFNGADGGDLCGDLGVIWTRGGDELLYVRSEVLLTARAAGLEVILDSVYADLEDDDGFAQDTEFGRRLGYTGRTAIHPRQLATINRVHTPTETEIESARELLAAFGEAEQAGIGAIRHRGKLVDYAMVRRAKRLLEQVRS